MEQEFGEVEVCRIKRDPPLFHLDNFGVTQRLSENSFLNISADQSVTQLSEVYIWIPEAETATFVGWSIIASIRP